MFWDEPDDSVFDDPFDDDGDFGALLVGKQPLNRYVVSYDIVNNTRRVRVAQCLDSYGQRVQKSVFEVLVSKALLTRMTRDLVALIDAGEDRVSIYPQCTACEARRVDLGLAPDRPEQRDWIIV